MICADATIFTIDEARRAAEAIRDRQLARLEAALAQVVARMPASPEVVIISGQGEFLARRLLERFSFGAAPPKIVSLSEALGPQVSRAAPAHALAVLARERRCGIISPRAISQSLA